MIEVYNKLSERAQASADNSCEHCGIPTKSPDEACATCASWLEVARCIEVTRRALREVQA